MYHFIPYWDNPQREWYFRRATWYWTRQTIDFDDTINRLRVFEQEGEHSSLLMLTYEPNLRYLLHQHELLGVDYWSVFDQIQGFSDGYTRPIDFLDLDWPEDITFHYTLFLVLARRNGQRYAEIEFAEDGNLFFITFFEHDVRSRVIIFDDRGYVSSIEYFDEDGEPHYQDYLDARGIWRIRQSLGRYGTEVTVNPQFQTQFGQRVYASMSMLIEEKLSKHLASIESLGDTVIIAASAAHNELLLRAVPPDYNVVFSFHSDRDNLEDDERQKRSLFHDRRIKLLVAGNDAMRRSLEIEVSQFADHPIPVMEISPYDTRMRLGLSQRIKKLIVAFFIDGLTEQQFYDAFTVFREELEENELIDLHLITFIQEGNPFVARYMDAENELLDEMEEERQIEERRQEYGEDEDEIDIEDERQVSAMSEVEPKRVELKKLLSENDAMNTLSYARLLVDLNDVPNTYLQIMGVSTGIPQIHRAKTAYVEHKKNGYIIRDADMLKEALHYYRDGLRHWNEALDYSAQKIRENSGPMILEKWEELLS